MNISLLCKWWWRLETEDGLWQKIIRYKYLRNKSVCSVKHKQTNSAIWSDLLKIKDIYLQGKVMKLKNGNTTLFWKDRWLFDQPLSELFPDLFAMCMQQNISVATVKNNPESVTFTRWLVDNWRVSWEKILKELADVQLSDGEDEISWKFGNKGVFSVKTVYNAMTANESGTYAKTIWKGKIPSKIKIFLWMVANNAILTKDNMIKRNWQGDPTCFFCSSDENVSHLLFQCSTARAVWATVAICIGADDIPNSF